MSHIGVVGAGAWGSALAVVLARKGCRVSLWAHETEVVEAIIRERRNPLFLPGIAMDGVDASTDLAILAKTEAILLVAPSQFLRGVCRRLAPICAPGTPLVVCAKGIESGSLALMSEVVAEEMPGQPLAVLSGPTFAVEVARIVGASARLIVGTKSKTA